MRQNTRWVLHNTFFNTANVYVNVHPLTLENYKAEDSQEGQHILINQGLTVIKSIEKRDPS